MPNSMPNSILRASAIVLLSTGAILCAAPTVTSAAISVGISVNIAPPELPVYVQPPVPAPGYIWTPGYWAWTDGGYYWVPGTWVEPPEVGFLWTPGYWGWESNGYLWHAGYWGPHVGFYGGVNYGYGYTGSGFEGGYWRDRKFYYNRSVANVRTTNITTVYNKTIVNRAPAHRVSYNGGKGGLSARPSSAQEVAARDRHVAFTQDQEKHEHLAAGNQQLRASVNHGRPAVAATARPAEFSGKGVVAARPAVNHNNGGNVVRRNEPHMSRPVAEHAANPVAHSQVQAHRPQPQPQVHQQPQMHQQTQLQSHQQPQAAAQQHEMPQHAQGREPRANHAEAPRPAEHEHNAQGNDEKH